MLFSFPRNGENLSHYLYLCRCNPEILSKKQMKETLMDFIRHIFLLLTLTFFTSVSLSAQENPSYFLHTVEKGQSLYSISSMYGVDQAEIVRLNPGSQEKIYAGQALRIPQAAAQQKGEIFHTIQAGETLYKLTTVYKVSAKAICDANPGLSAENFRIGQVILIPQAEEPEATAQAVVPATRPSTQGAVQSRCRDMHKVKRKETIFSLSREYGITQEELIAANPELRTEGLKKGKFICIPYPATPTALTPGKPTEPSFTSPPSDRQLFLENKEQAHSISTIKAGLILPLLPDVNRRNEVNRMLEYYEGFLLAVDSLKRTGVSIDLYVYDSGTENTSLAPILAKEEMKSMDIIFGPLHQNHIKPLAEFAKEHDIRLVIPFTSRDNEVFSNPSVYQINTPQSYLYSEVYEHFVRLFPRAHVIILETGDGAEKAEFIAGLKQELTNRGITVQTASGTPTAASLKNLLQPDKENIFIPDNGSDVTLIKYLPVLTLVVRENPSAAIHLFGYPEWQTYTKDHLEGFFELDTYFYSSFYTNNLLPGAVNFTNKFHQWYGKEMGNNYPKYGMLGYDTAFFFLKGLSQYGSGLENNLSRMNINPVQTGFKFDRVNNWGGFINRKVFFVRFTKNYELIKLDFE